MGITSTAPFSIAHRAAIVDRLIFNGTITDTGTDPYRLAGTRARAEGPANAG